MANVLATVLVLQQLASSTVDVESFFASSPALLAHILGAKCTLKAEALPVSLKYISILHFRIIMLLRANYNFRAAALPVVQYNTTSYCSITAVVTTSSTVDVESFDTFGGCSDNTTELLISYAHQYHPPHPLPQATVLADASVAPCHFLAWGPLPRLHLSFFLSSCASLRFASGRTVA